MAVRNTRTGGARKRVAGEKPTTKKVDAKPAAKPAVKKAVKAAPKAAPKKPTTPTSSEAITSRRPQMNDQYKQAPKEVHPKEKPAPKTTVKVDPTRKRTGQMDEISTSQFTNKKKTPTGSK